MVDMVDDLLSGTTPDFIQFTLESAALVPATLPMWPISVNEALSYVRRENRLKLWSPARYEFVSVCLGVCADV